MSRSLFPQPPSAAPAFEQDVPVIFAHCDPAGIVFYPRLVEMINNVVEAWFDRLGCSFARMHGELAMGVPTVTLQVEFVKACRLGEVLQMRLHVQELAANRVSLRVQALCQGELRWQAAVTLVCVQLKPLQSTRWPPDLWQALQGAAQPLI
ncbi:MAG: acyl-CoA thioesterase [Betaproteobacteria bacterium]|jgi:4-hydroxybenzoyl-CoA thioesterase|nr:acyl-CoA thioesterase [Betaproteobacteria bacterium]